jgi:antitoxin component of MazEF toxin-antitoxin module
MRQGLIFDAKITTIGRSKGVVIPKSIIRNLDSESKYTFTIQELEKEVSEDEK